MDNYFLPKVNILYERHLFSNMKLDQNETVDQFITRLRVRGDNCDFGDKLSESIVQQVVNECQSHKLRVKLINYRK